jgi:hypothetical protein
VPASLDGLASLDMAASMVAAPAMPPVRFATPEPPLPPEPPVRSGPVDPPVITEPPEPAPPLVPAPPGDELPGLREPPEPAPEVARLPEAPPVLEHPPGVAQASGCFPSPAPHPAKHAITVRAVGNPQAVLCIVMLPSLAITSKNDTTPNPLSLGRTHCPAVPAGRSA